MRRYCKAHCPAFANCRGVVPANYSKERRITNSSGRLASMQWGKIIPHIPAEPDLTDIDPQYRIEDFIPVQRTFGNHVKVIARAKAKKEGAKAQTEIELEY